MTISFMHGGRQSPTTLSEIKRLHDWVDTTDFFGCYAYATQSGVSSFGLKFDQAFWEGTNSKWLFGLDYGRTQPKALRSIADKPNANVRIFDGAFVMDQDGFLPRRDYHAKMAVLLNPDASRYGMVVGSGNFSANGLRASVEAGASLRAKSVEEFQGTMESNVNAANDLWANSTPLADILDDYEEKWDKIFGSAFTKKKSKSASAKGSKKYFWIEAGYVTQNRGKSKPGNQIDFPRGMGRYFGFDVPDDLPKNSIIGKVKFVANVGEAVSNNLRLGNNLMEKISLPMPETHGFDIYDGKVLVFGRRGNGFLIQALEAADFEAAFATRITEINLMGSGRRYGLIE